MNDPKVIKFLDKEYRQADLPKMDDAALLELRNLIATNLGLASIKGFRDHDMAVEQTWKALEKFEETVAAESAGKEPKPAKEPKAPKAPKPPKEPKDYKLAKSAEPHLVKRPTDEMFDTIKKTGTHDGTQGRQRRWDNYRDGMMMVEVIEGNGTEPWDVKNWVSKGIMEIVKATPEELVARRAAWYASHNLTDPEVAKAEKERKKAEDKAKREADAAAKKEAADKAKAEAEKKAAETAPAA